jgi:NADPH:quinone reductase-like Zn-dependent oxidoreductase
VTRAAVLGAFGGPDSIEVRDVPTPEPGPGEVTVDVVTAAVNFPDLLMTEDRYQLHPPLPFTPGSEFSGEVRATGPGVTAWAAGDRVVGVVLTGAFATQVVVDVRSLRPIPSSVDFDSAAAFGVAYRTAYHALRTVASLAPGDQLVVLGASGAVGLATIQLGRLMGARTIAVSQGSKLATCRRAGADEAVAYDDPQIKGRVLEATAGAGADVVIDTVGGPASESALRACRYGSRFVTVGYASGQIPRIPLNLVLLKGVQIVGLEIRSLTEHRPEEVARGEAELWRWLEAGDIQPAVAARFELESVADALRFVGERRQIGKVLVAAGPPGGAVGGR